jgi:putative endonuclease
MGVTSNLIQRIWQHREGLVEGFTKQYDVKMLVWYEQHATTESAISKEKAMKKWLRQWKLAAIEKTNPYWHDLWPEIIGAETPAVVPAKAGIQDATTLDSRFRGNDGRCGVLA